MLLYDLISNEKVQEENSYTNAWSKSCSARFLRMLSSSWTASELPDKYDDWLLQWYRMTFGFLVFCSSLISSCAALYLASKSPICKQKTSLTWTSGDKVTEFPSKDLKIFVNNFSQWQTVCGITMHVTLHSSLTAHYYSYLLRKITRTLRMNPSFKAIQ